MPERIHICKPISILSCFFLNLLKKAQVLRLCLKAKIFGILLKIAKAVL